VRWGEKVSVAAAAAISFWGWEWGWREDGRREIEDG